MKNKTLEEEELWEEYLLKITPDKDYYCECGEPANRGEHICENVL